MYLYNEKITQATCAVGFAVESLIVMAQRTAAVVPSEAS